MASLRRSVLLGVATVALGCATLLAQPSPPVAEANVLCDVQTAVPDAITGGLGIGSPVGDACETVTAPTDAVTGIVTDPLEDVAGDIGNSIFQQITDWVAEGAGWLLGEVAVLAESTTTPDLTDPGFLRQYKKMIAVAAFLAALMLMAAIFEAISRGDAGMLIRIFAVTLPLAALGASVAFLLVGLLVAMVDGLCEAVTATTGADTKQFFKAAIEGLGKVGESAGDASEGITSKPVGGLGDQAKVGVPLFVGFIAAILAAFAAFFIWIELLMRDAAVYAVALFAPLGLAAGIWPRWSGAVRRTAELIFAIVFSKFVIVAILALAASLLAKGEGGIENVLAAGALLLLACFSPMVLMRFLPIAEGAMIAAFGGRRSAAGGTLRTAHEASFMEQTARRNWQGQGGGKDTGVHAIKTAKGGKGPAAGGGGGVGSGAGKAAGASGGAGAASGVAGPAAAAAAVPIATAKAAQGAAEHLEGSVAAGAGAQGQPQSQPVVGKDKIADRFAAATSPEAGSQQRAAGPRSEAGGVGEEARPAAEKPPRPPAGGTSQPRPKEERKQ